MADSRIIKFRAWDKRVEEMIFTGFHIHGVMVNADSLAYEEYEPLADLLKNTENLMQFTGLLDKVGKEIYEEDIFIAPHDFGPGGFQQKQAVVRFHECYGYQWEYWDVKNLIIIGNIYEHSHLLDEKDKGS